MSKNQEYKPKKRYQPTYKYAILIIGLNLFIIGLFLIIIYYSNSTITKLKQDFEIELILDDNLVQSDIDAIKQTLLQKDYLHKINYRSKEVAAEIYEKELGQDFTQILGYNPMYNAFIVNLKAKETDADHISAIKSDFMTINGIKEVNYSEPLSNMFGKVIRPVFVGIIVVSLILFLIAFSVIDGTIRLMMYTQRYAIRTMQLIGGTKWFIINPFLSKSVVAACMSAAIAILALAGLFAFFINKYSIVLQQADYLILAGIGGALILISLFISLISTFFAVNKYWNVKLDDLF
jgi:cell division transport system permease protein